MRNGPNGPLRGCESAKAGDPHSAGPGAGVAALRAPLSALGSEAGGISDVCRVGAAERAVWPVGRAGTAAT
eukprot:14115075-Alexandrium_andersonii.AAC.1